MIEFSGKFEAHVSFPLNYMKFSRGFVSFAQRMDLGKFLMVIAHVFGAFIL